MVSDVLSDGADRIRWYLKEMPDVYEDLKPRLDKLLAEMDAIRVELDTPPKD